MEHEVNLTLGHTVWNLSMRGQLNGNTCRGFRQSVGDVGKSLAEVKLIDAREPGA